MIQSGFHHGAPVTSGVAASTSVIAAVAPSGRPAIRWWPAPRRAAAGRVHVVDVDQVDHAGFEVQRAGGQPDRMGMRANQVLVAQFEPGRGHRTGDHVLTAGEIVGVVGVSGGAVGQHDRGLPGPASPAGTLSVVGRGRRDVAHPHHVEASDIDAEFHRGRAVQHRQFGVAEEVFAFLAGGGLRLGRCVRGPPTRPVPWRSPRRAV